MQKYYNEITYEWEYSYGDVDLLAPYREKYPEKEKKAYPLVRYRDPIRQQFHEMQRHHLPMRDSSKLLFNTQRNFLEICGHLSLEKVIEKDGIPQIVL